MHIYIIADKVNNLIRDANVFISYGKRFHPLHLIISLCLPFAFPCSRRPFLAAGDLWFSRDLWFRAFITLMTDLGRMQPYLSPPAKK